MVVANVLAHRTEGTQAQGAKLLFKKAPDNHCVCYAVTAFLYQ
jgi:hypothetical protein